MKNNPMRTLVRFSIAIVLAIVFASNLTNNASADAVTTHDLFTANDGVRWEWERVMDADLGKEQVSIKFYDRPVDLATVTVPSLSEVITASGASSTLDTYLLENADEEAQETSFAATAPKREATTSVTKLDLTNTSKIQIIGVKPILDPNTEAEIVFGENVVIGDGIDVDRVIEATPCDMFWDEGDQVYYCSPNWNNLVRVEDLSSLVSGWNFLSNYEKMTHEFTPEDLGYTSITGQLEQDEYDSNARYMYPYAMMDYHAFVEDGAFMGYKLKLTGLENVKYIGWYAFMNSNFNEANLELTIGANQTTGAHAFENTNITKVTLENTETSDSLFKDCTNLTTVDFGNVETVSYRTFQNDNIGSELDLSATNITKVLGEAFRNTGLTSLDLGSVETIGARAFADNDIKEVYLPKTINELKEEQIFLNNDNLTKLTVAYDTLTTGTENPLHSLLGEDVRLDGKSVAENIKELIVLAPYAANEPVKATHLNYEDVLTDPSHYYGYDVTEPDAIRLRKGNSYKNVIAPNYFYGFSGLEKLTIGEGYELIGYSAFYCKDQIENGMGSATTIEDFKDKVNNGRYSALTNVSLPETLKAIDALAFASHYNPSLTINLPESLEFIGNRTFFYTIGMHNDIDLPNLTYLGEHAFYISGVRNVTLHDSLEYIGTTPFLSAYYINDVTIDFDVFGSEKTKKLFGEHFGATFFGHIFANSASFKIENLPNTIKNSLSFKTAYSTRSESYSKKYIRKVGTITFTEKVQTTPSFDWKFQAVYADKIDLGKVGWKSIPANTFIDAVVDELILPEKTESIGVTAFYNTRIEKELVLPETLKTIHVNAFNNQTEVNNHYYYNDGTNCYHFRKVTTDETSYCNSGFTHGVTIKHLPNSITTISEQAFFGDYYLDTDFDLTNVTYVGAQAFMKTGVKNVTLKDNIQRLGSGAFLYDNKLNDIVIDLDLYNPSISSDYDSFYKNFSSIDPDRYSNDQSADGSTFHNVTFTSKAVTEPVNIGAIYSNFTMNKFDLSQTTWKHIPSVWGMLKSKVGEVLLPETLEIIPLGFFFETEVEEPVVIPATVKTIDKFAFQWSNLEVENALPEGIETIEDAAFYGAKVADDLVVPNTVSFIGPSAFNAGDKDVEYNSVTIRPDLDYVKTKNQAIFQLFWNAKMKTLIIESSMLPVLGTLQDPAILPEDIEVGDELVSPLRADGEPEFHGMQMEEVVIRNLPVITDNAFEECGSLKKVDFTDDANLVEIGKFAFNNDTNLKNFEFGDINNGKDIDLKEYAFNNTAIQVIAGKGSNFDLTAAKFNAVEPHVFANLPNLKKVVVPNTFSVFEAANDENGTNGSTIPSGTFADDVELEEVRVNYQLSTIKDGAFTNDNKIKKFFIWGNTEIEELDETEPTIPAPTNVFAYSDSPAEDYVMKGSREEYEGKFYPLDEVLYITSNKKFVLLTDDKQDWDKTGLHLYAMRRDGVILESDEWLEYTTAYPRSEKPEVFGEGKGALYDDALAMDVYDAEKPFALVSLTNRNFQATTFDLIQEEDKETMTLVIHYTDGYTVAIRDTAPDAVGEDELEEYLKKLNPTNDDDDEEEEDDPVKPEPEEKPEDKPKEKTPTTPETKPVVVETDAQEDELEVPNTGNNPIESSVVVASTSIIAAFAVVITLVVREKIKRK